MNRVPELAVIGAGQLGSRHLQALSQLDRAAHVTIVDPFPASLERARLRFAEATLGGTQVKLTLTDRVCELPKSLDVVIIATNADQRADVVRDLLNHSRVQYLVLEKVLFPRDEDYTDIADHLAAASTPAWVNCPRRMWPDYQLLRSELRKQGPFSYRIIGSGWGLACNSIHFVDHAAFLLGRDDFRIADVALKPGSVPSKRFGYVEFLGTLWGEFGDGSRVELGCSSETAEPITIVITTSSRQYTIREDRAELQWKAASSLGEAGSRPLQPVFQSQLSQLFTQSLLDDGTCSLTAYAESSRLHRPLLAALLQHYRIDCRPGAEACPIT